MVDFTVMDGINGSIGGLLIGIASSVHYMKYERLTGASGILENVFSKGGKPWHTTFMVGVFHAATIYIMATGGITFMAIPYYFLIIAGLLVGFGARLGSGCTSGHGICGLSRLNLRSYVAVGTFMTTGVITANLVHHSYTYDYNSGGSSMLSEEWLTSNDYLGWGLFTLTSLVFLREIFEVIYPSSPDATITVDEEWEVKKKSMKQIVALYLVGATFGVGLSISGMINNGVVIHFLTFNKDWNPTLIFVMAFGVLVFGATFWYDYFSRKSARATVAGDTEAGGELEPIAQAPPPLLHAPSHLGGPAKPIDARLVVGSACFGCGWGLAGICPAPAVSVLSVPAAAIFFMPACFVGMKLVAVYLAHYDLEEDQSQEKAVPPAALAVTAK